MNSATVKHTMAIATTFALVAAWFCCELCLVTPAPECHLSAAPSGQSVTPSSTESCALACADGSRPAQDHPKTVCHTSESPAEHQSNHGENPGPCGDRLSCLLACPVDRLGDLIVFQAVGPDNLTPRSAHVPAGWLNTGAERRLSYRPALLSDALLSTGPSHPRPTLLSLHTMLTT